MKHFKKHNLLKKSIIRIFFLFFTYFLCIDLNAQNPSDWIWYNTDFLGTGSINDIKTGPDNAIWIAKGSKIARFDGNNWEAFDFKDAGISVQYNTIQNFDFAPDGKIWCNAYNRVLTLDTQNNTWILYDPSNNAVNINGQCIAVESNNKVWWGTSSGLFLFNDGIWQRYPLYKNGVGSMNTGSSSTIFLDHEKTKWLTTSSSICFDIPCFVPSGIIKLSNSDTIYYNGPSLGAPDANYICLAANKTGFPLAVISRGGFLQYSYFENGQWQPAVQIPVNMFANASKMDKEGILWIGGSETDSRLPILLRVETNGSFSKYNLDENKILYIKTINIDTLGKVWIGGYDKNYIGSFGVLPKQNLKELGTVFIDTNTNGTLDLAEVGYSNGIVEITPGPYFVMANTVGEYAAPFGKEGTFQATLATPPYCTLTYPIGGSHLVTVTGSTPVVDGQHFGILPDYNASDLTVSMIGLTRTAPGFDACYRIDYQNLAPATASGKVVCQFDDKLKNPISITPAPSAINGNIYTFDFSNLEWHQIQQIQICFTLPPDISLMGQSLENQAWITVDGDQDESPQNNTAILKQLIRAAYDPNYKETYPPGLGQEGMIPMETVNMEYTIHFQNVGTDTAQTVIVTDSIDQAIDLKSLQVKATSHPYRLDLYDNRVLRWTFNNIFLPDSSTDAIRSNGFIKYTLKLMPNLPLGAKIKNKADIYFDFNPPVRTNTVINTLAAISSNTDLRATCPGNLYFANNFLYPKNPANEEGIKDICVFNAQGILLLRQETNGWKELSLAHLPPGVYFVKVSTNAACKYNSFRFVKFAD